MKLLLTLLLLITVNLYSQKKYGPIPVSATETNPNGGGFSKTLVYFNCSNSDGKVRKPLIVFEGYDPGYYTKPNNKEGRTGIQDFIDEISDDVADPATTILEDLLQGSTQQYDIIYVNWINGTDFLQNNALAAEEVIRRVNYLKTLSGSTEPNVIVGRSMGSILARMALRRMENRFAITGVRHNTRLFISSDGGQQGSNIPQGYQHLSNHFRDLYIATGPTYLAVQGSTNITNFFPENLSLGRRVGSPLSILSLNETPASQQLSINHVNSNNEIDNTLHNNLLDELEALGYPNGDGIVPFQRVAISNGSECGKPQDVGSGGYLLNYQGQFSPLILGSLQSITLASFAFPFALPAIAGLGSLPGRNYFKLDLRVRAKANNVANQVYRGKIDYTKKILGFIPVVANITNKSFNAQASTLAYDYFPGGNQDLSSELKLPGGGSDEWIEKNITFSHQPYCHVPVTSALDIGQGDVDLTFADYFLPYHGAAPPTGIKSSPFPAFITAFNGSPDNEGHTVINRRNGDWIAERLQGGTSNPINCSFVCSPPPITGDNSVCATSNPYSISNLPPGATVTWSVSPAGFVTINTPNASQTTLTKITNGQVTLTATVSSVCSVNVVIQKVVYAGPEPVNILGAFDPTYHTIMGEVCVGDPYYFVAGDPVSSNPLNTYTWTHFPPPGSPNSISLFSGANLNITFIEPGMHTLRVTKTNSCGAVVTNRVIEVLECFNFMYYSISPNPASSTINIGVNNKNTSQNRKVQPGSLNIDDVKIYDATGFLRLQQKGNKQQTVTINTSALTNGLYRVEISHAGKVERQQLLINR